MKAMDLIEKARCSLEERRSLIPLCRELTKFSEKARREDLLSLDPVIEKLPDSFLQTGLQLVTDGADSETIEQILLAQTLSWELSPVKMMESLLIMTTVDCLYQGINPRMVELLLSSWVGLPLSEIQEPEPEQKTDPTGHNSKFDLHFDATLWMNKEEFESYFTFEDLVNLEDRAIQKLLRVIPTEDLQASLMNASNALRDKFFTSLSKGALQTLKEEMDANHHWLRGKRRPDEAQTNILAITGKLLEQGELMIRKQEKTR